MRLEKFNLFAYNVLQICEVAKCAVGLVGGFAISQMCCYRFGAVYFVNNFIFPCQIKYLYLLYKPIKTLYAMAKKPKTAPKRLLKELEYFKQTANFFRNATGTKNDLDNAAKYDEWANKVQEQINEIVNA